MAWGSGPGIPLAHHRVALSAVVDYPCIRRVLHLDASKTSEDRSESAWLRWSDSASKTETHLRYQMERESQLRSRAGKMLSPQHGPGTIPRGAQLNAALETLIGRLLEHQETSKFLILPECRAHRKLYEEKSPKIYFHDLETWFSALKLEISRVGEPRSLDLASNQTSKERQEAAVLVAQSNDTNKCCLEFGLDIQQLWHGKPTPTLSSRISHAAPLVVNPKPTSTLQYIPTIAPASSSIARLIIPPQGCFNAPLFVKPVPEPAPICCRFCFWPSLVKSPVLLRVVP